MPIRLPISSFEKYKDCNVLGTRSKEANSQANAHK
jgi:hypothetical protein